VAARVEFFFDLSSPWTRLAFANIGPILADAGTDMVLRPMLVGGVFNAVNPDVYGMRADMAKPKYRNMWKWLKEWAQLTGVEMNFPSQHHPLKSVNAMRMCCAIEHDQTALHRFAGAAFEAYFAEQRNLDDMAELVAVADACGLEGAALAESCASPAIKDRLRANTQEAVDRGAYGSPTLFVDGQHMYFGNDQLPLVRARLLED